MQSRNGQCRVMSPKTTDFQDLPHTRLYQCYIHQSSDIAAPFLTRQKLVQSRSGQCRVMLPKSAHFPDLPYTIDVTSINSPTLQLLFHSLTQKGAQFLWTSEGQTALPFGLQTDASSVGVSAVAEQVGRLWHMLAAHSQSQSVIHRECLAAVYSMKQFRHYLLGRYILQACHGSCWSCNGYLTENGGFALLMVICNSGI